MDLMSDMIYEGPFTKKLDKLMRNTGHNKSLQRQGASLILDYLKSFYSDTLGLDSDNSPGFACATEDLKRGYMSHVKRHVMVIEEFIRKNAPEELEKVGDGLFILNFYPFPMFNKENGVVLEINGNLYSSTQ